MYYEAFPRFNTIRVIELDENTTVDEIKTFINTTTKQKYINVHPSDELGTFVIEFSIKGKITLPKGSLIFSSCQEFYYILKEDVEGFKEYFKLGKIENHYVKPIRAKRKVTKKVAEQFICPVCNYIASEPFDKCPSCSCSEGDYNNLNSCTDINKKARKKKMFDLDKIREEQCKDITPTEVTAVYGDSVSVSKENANEQKQEKETETAEGSDI